MGTATVKSKVARFLAANPKTWLSTTDIRSFGGDTATRRLRELRSEGWNIKTGQTETGEYQYKLTRVPAKKVLSQYV